ncbi:heavy-metal-associated domain-containing protein [Tissierella creatinini]|nr:heavy-metal-associated domain-containing protein [Tissierella creatinini]TJX61487.1 heavy-metal-associated domain-containing protein [Soehngenia saccharolytica]
MEEQKRIKSERRFFKMQNENKEEQGLENVNFKLEGLSCSCEAQIVEKRVKALKGVKSYSLNPISYKMKIGYDPTLVTVEEIQKAVSKAGAKAVLLGTK